MTMASAKGDIGYISTGRLVIAKGNPDDRAYV
jgi:hypothetical protein